MKKRIAAFLCLVMVFSFCACQKNDNANENPSDNLQSTSKYDDYEDAYYVELRGDKAYLNGEPSEYFEYTWNISPFREDPWYEGEKPDTDAPVYVARDIWYYPELTEDGFRRINYDGEMEWVYNYLAEGLTDYIFSTLPSFGTAFPAEMMHTKEEAYENPVFHITKPGTYVLSGEWNGQILIDLGDKDECFTDESKKVNIVLAGVKVNCTVAPAFICYSAYECDNSWEERESYSNSVNTENAGLNVIIEDGSVNSFTGANIYRLLKPVYKKNSSSVQKKYLKIDGAFYSYVSMNINGQEKGSGILNVTSTSFEGMGSELHLTINGGNINIYSQDDAINVNEDNVSVFTMNDGCLHIFAGLGSEGDGIDSNGYIVVNGGIIAGGTPSGSDSLLDSDKGNTLNGGQVITIGSSGFGGMNPGDRFNEGNGWMNNRFPGDFAPGDRDNEFGKPFNDMRNPNIPNNNTPNM